MQQFSIRDGMTSHRIFSIVGILAAIAAVFWICTFKIMDRDFWWHITAGDVLLSTGRMITVDPFAYTREGLPYLATHEWLAQIVLHLLYTFTGSTGIILFRGVVACGAVGITLALSTRLRYAYLLLAVWAVVITKGSFLERPQLFTFLFFSSFLFLAFRYLDAASWRKRYAICGAWIILELLWVNMHGGAALLGGAIVTCVLLQECWNAFNNRFARENRWSCATLGTTLLLLGGTLLLPPNGLGTFTYVSQLLHDRTIQFIAEWQPRSLLLSLGELWIFGALAIIGLAVGRRHAIFNTLALLMGTYLARQAFRHEILFILTALATFYYQADRSALFETLFDRLRRRRAAVGIIALILTLLATHAAIERSRNFERQDNLFGFGAFDLAQGAYDFLERERIQGNMFNTYGIGGYLIHRGFPDRKVFIDGRNVDYGFDFMLDAYAAGLDAERWRTLEDRYDIEYAVIDYNAIREQDHLPYSGILENDPTWALVYLDDWVAVYLKRTPVHQPIIDRLGFAHVTATTLQFDDAFSGVADTDLPALIAELQRMQRDNPEGIKATVALAKLALRRGKTAEAATYAQEAIRLRPQAPEPFVVLAASYVSEERWTDAADAYIDLLERAGDQYPDLNYGYIAQIFEKAGYSWRAWYYRPRTASHQPTPDGLSDTAVLTASGSQPLSVNPVQDAIEFDERGTTAAESGRFAEAEEAFRNALKINPHYAQAWSNLCALFLAQEQTQAAIDACARAIEIDAEYADAQYNLALAYFRSGDVARAKDHATRAKTLGRSTEADALLRRIDENE